MRIKNIFISILKSIGYAGIYLIAQVAIAFIYGIVYVAVNVNKFGSGNYNNIADNFQKEFLGQAYIIALIAAIVTFGIYVLMFRNKEENLFMRCRFKAFNLKAGLSLIPLTIALSAFSVSLVGILVQFFPSYQEVSDTLQAANGSIISALAITMLAPIFEEILFRGIVFNELKKSMPVIPAIIAQGVLFGIYHLNLLQCIYAAILGCVLGLIYQMTRSLWSNIIVHMIYNLLGVFVMPYVLDKTSWFVIGYIILGAILTGIILRYIYKKTKVELMVIESDL
ncbi:CPBP family intramembrane glutamic endopeptidase [Clostridium sp. 'White wine YQ']|uniref:CPBP family intramembrane glutamic endopeptidase n=1 Tax=Clostridium sp. 'White wine YQ' TaxID=3027474 RepID=UPI0023653006|nr:CPBP family intramembrane glutamic endopeptidase [Clostridium sp. 'White wine YQ']MDD7796373.1 CPBP family intramembrane metalloprotease [Clostridium sp. 'White wine YQ']